MHGIFSLGNIPGVDRAITPVSAALKSLKTDIISSSSI